MLRFDDLRRANQTRQAEWPGNEKADVAFRALEVAGEAGEVAEAVKKYLRGERGIGGNVGTVDDVAREIADVVISLDLLADALGIDMANAVRRKFNATSAKYGLLTTIEPSFVEVQDDPS